MLNSMTALQPSWGAEVSFALPTRPGREGIEERFCKDVEVLLGLGVELYGFFGAYGAIGLQCY